MFQEINNVRVYVIDLPAWLPDVTYHALDKPELKPYAEALTNAIRAGIVKEPGKYGIYVDPFHSSYQIFKIIE